MPSTEAILDVLRSMERECGCDEFAYLTVTSKIENPFRDQMAYRLHKRLAECGKIVSREWTPYGSKRRMDIAILNSDGTPETLIELKAMYTFDGLRGGTNSLGAFEKKVKGDLVKATQASQPYLPKVFALLLASHVTANIPVDLTCVVKYAPDINKALQRHGGNIPAMLGEKAAKALHPLNIVRFGEVDGGKAFSLSPRVLYWLVEA